MGRNTALLKEIVTVLDAELDDVEHAVNQLENHFYDTLLVNAGNVTDVGIYAEQLRLHISQEERFMVLDYVADQKLVSVTIDIVETAINDLLGWDRFVEP